MIILFKLNNHLIPQRLSLKFISLVYKVKQICFILHLKINNLSPNVKLSPNVNFERFFLFDSNFRIMYYTLGFPAKEDFRGNYFQYFPDFSRYEFLRKEPKTMWNFAEIKIKMRKFWQNKKCSRKRFFNFVGNPATHQLIIK